MPDEALQQQLCQLAMAGVLSHDYSDYHNTFKLLPRPEGAQGYKFVLTKEEASLIVEKLGGHMGDITACLRAIIDEHKAAEGTSTPILFSFLSLFFSLFFSFSFLFSSLSLFFSFSFPSLFFLFSFLFSLLFSFSFLSLFFSLLFLFSFPSLFFSFSFLLFSFLSLFFSFLLFSFSSLPGNFVLNPFFLC